MQLEKVKKETEKLGREYRVRKQIDILERNLGEEVETEVKIRVVCQSGERKKNDKLK